MVLFKAAGPVAAALVLAAGADELAAGADELAAGAPTVSGADELVASSASISSFDSASVAFGFWGRRLYCMYKCIYIE